MSVLSRRRRSAQAQHTIAQKRDAVFAFLNHPNLSQLTDREISRRTRVSQPFVSKLRKAVISQGDYKAAQGLITAIHAANKGHFEAISESPGLSSHGWATAELGEQRRFVDGIGLRALYDAAPLDHRDAFFASLIAQLPRTERPAHLPTNVEMYLNRIDGRRSPDNTPDIPPCLQRKPANIPASPTSAPQELTAEEELAHA
jgi:hypothetical protein